MFIYDGCFIYDYFDTEMIKPIITKSPRGYVQVTRKRKVYLAHRVIWEIVNGPIPEGMQIDHINQIKDDNRIENLRLVSRTQNLRNKPIQSNNNSGFSGVTWNSKKSKWHCRIGVNGKDVHLGYFSDLYSAIKSRKQANLIYGFHENHGMKKPL